MIQVGPAAARVGLHVPQVALETSHEAPHRDDARVEFAHRGVAFRSAPVAPPRPDPDPPIGVRVRVRIRVGARVRVGVRVRVRGRVG